VEAPASTVMPKLSSTSAAAAMVGRSLSDPMMIPTDGGSLASALASPSGRAITSLPFQLNMSILKICAIAAITKRLAVELKRNRVARPGRRIQRVCTGTPVHHEHRVRERVARPVRRIKRVCTGTPVHSEQIPCRRQWP